MNMAYQSLRDFISELERRKQLIRIKEQVSTELEITEIHNRVLQEGGPVLLFENVITEHGKSTMPVLVNLFGTVERVALGMGLKVDQLREFGEQLAFLRQPKPPGSIKEAISMLPLLKQAMTMKPKVVKKAACQEVVWMKNKIDLNKLPIQTCWPNEPAPLITWPLIVSKHYTTGIYNLGIYRMQVMSRDKTIMRWLNHRGGASHWRSWKQAGEKKMPIAAVIGTDPGTIIAAVTPVPDQMSEYEYAGLMRKQKVELVKCKTVPLLVPASAEIVIEGFVSTSEMADEGPYGDHTGYYNSVEQFPVFEVTAITMRKDPIYLSTFTGRPPDEPSILGEALNEVFVPMLKQQFPEIIDFWLPPEGCSYRISVVSMKKSYPGHAKRVMLGIWSFLAQFMYTKFIIVVDEDIDVRNWKDVMWAISTRMDFARDITVIENTPIDYLDFASPESGLGAKMGFDATNKMPPETHREWGHKIAMTQDIIDLVNRKWHLYKIK